MRPRAAKPGGGAPPREPVVTLRDLMQDPQRSAVGTIQRNVEAHARRPLVFRHNSPVRPAAGDSIDAKCRASRVRTGVGNGSNARASTGVANSSSATRLMSARTAAPCEHSTPRIRGDGLIPAPAAIVLRTK